MANKNTSNSIEEKLEENLDRAKKTTTDAGSVEFMTVDDAIKLEEYKAKVKKRAGQRIRWNVIGHREF